MASRRRNRPDESHSADDKQEPKPINLRWQQARRSRQEVLPIQLQQQPAPEAASCLQRRPFHFKQKATPCSETWGQQAPRRTQFQLQPGYLFKVDGSPAAYETKLDELHPQSQNLLRQIDEQIQQYQDESQRLDRCGRLYDSSVHIGSFERDAHCIIQDLEGINISITKVNASLEETKYTVNDVMRNTNAAVRSYMMLRPSYASIIGPATSTNRPILSSVAPVYGFYNGLPNRPSSFMQSMSARFENRLTECFNCIEELEQLVLRDHDKASSSSRPSLESIPKVLSNIFDFFMCVADKVENLHQYVESKKKVHLTDRRQWGDRRDPFLEADNRDTNRQEVASRRVHPTFHFPAISTQPSCQLGAASAPSYSLPGSGFSHQPTAFGTASAPYLGSFQTPPLFGASIATQSVASIPTVDIAMPAADSAKDPRSISGFQSSVSRRKSPPQLRLFCFAV